MKKFKTIKQRINSTIKKGDIVRIWDGSYLALDSEENDKEYFIVYSYYETTGFNTKLKDMDAEVLEVGIKDVVSWTELDLIDICVLLDIVVQVGKARFRTCSEFVRKV